MANTQPQTTVKTVSQSELQKQLEEDVKNAEAGMVMPTSVPAPVTPLVPPKPPVAVPVSQANATALLEGDARRTKAILDAGPKMKLSLPCYQGEKPGVSEDVAIINGYRYTMKKGVMVEVPEAVGKLFMDHYNIQQGETDAGRAKRIDRSEEHLQALE